MSTSTTHQQSPADSGSETRPPMLERGSYIPRASRFRRYLDRKRENKKWLNKAIDEGPYEFKDFIPLNSQTPRKQTEDDLTGDDLKHYEAEIEAMNLILISIPNDIYNSVDSCQIAQAMWRINTKFLNCLQPQWLKYVTQVRLAKRLTKDTYDDLFDYLYQYEQQVNASRAKKLEKSHDPFALMAHTGPSSRHPSAYYVTHPPSVVDYDDDYQGDEFQNNSEDPLTSAMMLLARAITQRFSNPTNNRLRTSSNTRNQAIVQADRVNIQRINSGNDGRNTRRSYVQEEIMKGNNVQNDAGNTQRTLRTTSLGAAANVQCYNCSEKGHYARNCPKPKGQAMILHSSVRQVDVHQDELCPLNKHYALMDVNKKIDLDNLLCQNESKILADILQNHPLKFSIAASTSVPCIYLGQFWHTLKEDRSKYRLKFVLDIKELTLTLDDFRRIFQLPHATDNNYECFVVAPKFSEMVPFFLNDLGFTLELRSPSNFKTIGLVQPWQTLYMMSNHMSHWVDVPTTRSQPIESTQGTHRTPSTPRIPNPEVSKGESSAQQKSIVIRLHIPQRRSTRLTPPTPIPTATEHLAAKEIEKMVEGTEKVDANEFVNSIFNSKNDLGTRLDPESYKESPEVEITVVVQPVNVIEEEDESAEDDYELRRRGLLMEKLRMQAEVAQMVADAIQREHENL
ncbi:gag-pol polyprotein [Tanacetum coccineum]